MTKSVHSERYQRLLKLLIESRQRAGLSQMALAQRLSRLQTFVSKYERGERRLDIVEFLDVTAALGADPHKVLRTLQAVDK